MNNIGSLVKSFAKVGLNKTRKSFIGFKKNRGLASTRRIVVAARMKSKAEAKAEIERKEEELKAIRKAKLKATRKAKAAELKAVRNAEAAELKKLEEREKRTQANLNGLMNAFGKMNFAKNSTV